MKLLQRYSTEFWSPGIRPYPIDWMVMTPDQKFMFTRYSNTTWLEQWAFDGISLTHCRSFRPGMGMIIAQDLVISTDSKRMFAAHANRISHFIIDNNPIASTRQILKIYPDNIKGLIFDDYNQR